jgi:magnesium transporter
MPKRTPASSTVIEHTWPKDSAGHRMTTKVPVTTPEKTLAEVEAMLKREIKKGMFKSIDYIYVLDAKRRFIGILSQKDLYRYTGTAKVGKVCKRKSLIHMKASSHQERAAYLALQHNIKAIPITDHNHVFLGVIHNDALLSILYKEMHEDILHLVGIHHSQASTTSVFELSLFDSFWHRAPWLFLGMVGGLLSANIIGLFENTLQENLILASFIPLIMYMSGAVGAQMVAYVVRDLALDQKLAFGKYFLRQSLIVLMVSVCFGLLLFLMSMVFQRGLELSMTLGISLFGAIASSIVSGLLVPYAFARMRMDPADASGPIVTIIQDILSIVLYFAIATALL